MDPAIITSLIRVLDLAELARAVGVALTGIHVESVDGQLGRFDSEQDESDFRTTIELAERMEAIAGLPPT